MKTKTKNIQKCYLSPFMKKILLINNTNYFKTNSIKEKVILLEMYELSNPENSQIGVLV